MQNTSKILVKWLNNAYVMERGVEKILNQHIADAEGEIVLQRRLEQCLEATKRQAELLKIRILELDGQPANIRARLADVAGFMQGITVGGTEDELAQNLLSAYATQHYQIANYKALVTMAELLEDWETAILAKEILRQEQQISELLMEELPEKVEQFIRKRKLVMV